MKYTFEGFSQQALVDFGLNLVDAGILRFVVDFWHSGKMVKHIIQGKEYFWIDYQHLIDECPVIEISNPIVLRRRFVKYLNCGLMESQVIRGNVTCYRFTEKYSLLISKPAENTEVTETPKPKSLGAKRKSLPPKPKSSAPKQESLGALNPKVEGSIYKDDSSTKILLQEEEERPSEKMKIPIEEHPLVKLLSRVCHVEPWKFVTLLPHHGTTLPQLCHAVTYARTRQVPSIMGWLWKGYDMFHNGQFAYTNGNAEIDIPTLFAWFQTLPTEKRDKAITHLKQTLPTEVGSLSFEQWWVNPIFHKKLWGMYEYDQEQQTA